MTKLYIGNLADNAKEKDIRELFQAFGEVEEVALLRGYGFVHFVKSEDANAALSALDDSEFMGAHIQVQMSRTKGHGYGRGSGPPRPRAGRGSPPPRGYKDGYRERGRYGPYDAPPRDYDRYSRGYDHYYDDRYAGDRTTGGDYYDRYDRIDRNDYYDRYDYSRYSSGGSGGSGGGGGYRERDRSRSPVRDAYRDRGGRGYYDRESYRDGYSAREGGGSRRW